MRTYIRLKYARRCRLRYTLIVILLVLILIRYKIHEIYTHTPECEVPIFIMRLYKTPMKFHKTTCSASAIDKIIDLELISSDDKKSVPRYVVHEPIGGRIGNLMFQTASTFGIAATLKRKTYIDVKHPLLPYFEISPSKGMNLTNSIVLTEEECMDRAWRCRREIFSRNVTVQGWLQSWKYFHHIAPTIRKRFTVKSFYREQAKTFLGSMRIKDRTVIGIHVRRSDFDNAHFSQCGYAMAAPDYYKKAMKLYRTAFNNAIFIVISDSIEWCKQNIVAHDVIYSSFMDPIADLALMTMCNHMIVSGGTFGFWGAWLAGGKVIYPKGWPRPGSWLDLYGMVVDDFWPPDWIGL